MTTIPEPVRDIVRIGPRPRGREDDAAPDPYPGDSPVAAYLARIHRRHRETTDGTVATYIPELGKANPAWFGIAAATLDGVVHEVGDTRVPFTIQSISKPLTFALALDLVGEDAVRARIGVEPTGDAFNSITLDRATGRPLNPMVNAGAIAAAALLRASNTGSPLTRVLEGYGRFAGRPLMIDRAVEASERETGHRNRAIGHLLRASGALDGDADAAVEQYFAQCSVSVTAADLAVMAATLANGGVNPVTGQHAASPETVRAVLAVMATCGMYDGAGEWLFSVGIPAKSGVSGGILAVVPGRLGLGFYAPPLDAQGNSVRGGQACRDIVRDLDLHSLGVGGPPPSAVRTTFSVGQVCSKRQRTAATRRELEQHGTPGLVVELQGGLTFLAAEALAERIRAAEVLAGRALAVLVVDLRRVERVDSPSVMLLAEVCTRVSSRGGRIILSGTHRHADAVARLRVAVTGASGGSLEATDDIDTALETAEEVILAGLGDHASRSVDPTAHAALEGLGQADREIVVARGVRRSYAAGSTVVRAGDPSQELFLVLAGRLSVSIQVPGQGRRRLSTLGPGMVFGETAFLGSGQRGADVTADTPVDCLVLASSAFDALAEERPAAALGILRNLLRTATTTTGRLTAEMAVLAG